MKTIIASTLLTILFFSTTALAVDVIIDPSGASQYRINGSGGFSGIRTFNLAADTSHTVDLRHSTVVMNFHIDAVGNISTSSPWLSVSGNTITLITVPITVDPNGFLGSYSITARGQRNLQTVYLVPEAGSNYTAYIGQTSENNGFHFSFDAAGNLVSNSTRFTTGGDDIVFNTQAVNIDTNGYGQPLIDDQYNIAQFAYRGSQQIFLVPAGTSSDDFGSRYRTYVHGVSSNGFYFDVDSNGDVTADSTRISIAPGPTIVFNTSPVYIDTAAYELEARSVQANLPPNAVTGFNIIPSGTGSDDYGGHYIVQLGGDFSNNGFHFFMDSNGNVSTDSTRITTDGANTLIFSSTTAINVDPNNYLGTYRVGGKSVNGVNTVNVLPSGYGSNDYGNRYALRVGNNDRATISVEDPCAILPSPDVTVGSVEFHVSCPNIFIDTDEDGVADSSDNCPLIANADQLDQDGDGLGNACDDDLDGDDIDNTADNCPDISNTAQTDSDGDGIGDVCDDDVDGDGVNDNVDNCPLLANTDQADSDGDSLGDACDDDDDNDNVLDTTDNCPVTPNTDQTDSDGDGNGDACDADNDNDGVNNEFDVCPNTPLSSTVSAQGCDGYQLVAYLCKADDFPNHGKYVSCVAKAAQTAVDFGLLANNEKGKIVSQAAKK